MDDPDRKDAAGNCLESDETTTKLTCRDCRTDVVMDTAEACTRCAQSTWITVIHIQKQCHV